MRLVASVKDFNTKISEKSIGIWNVAFNSPIEFKEQLWGKSLPFIHRGMNMDTNDSGETIYMGEYNTEYYRHCYIYRALDMDILKDGGWLQLSLWIIIKVYVGK